MDQQKQKKELNRRERERQARVDLICRAATKIFSQKGFNSTTMEQIAEEAELGKSSLYYYFKTKQELFAYIISQALHTLTQKVIKSAAEFKDPFEIIDAYCRYSLKALRKNTKKSNKQKN